MSFQKPALPESIGRCADLYHDVRELRLAMAKEVEAVEEFEKEVRQHIIDNLSKSDDTGAAGLRYRAQVLTKVKPTVSDWPALQAHILKTSNFDLVQKRISDKAVADRWEAGEAIPGVERFNSVDVSITKI